MADPKDAAVGVKFHHGSPPYEAGDVAGFPRAVADRYVASGRASFFVPRVVAGGGADPFAAMTRADMIAYAREHLGLVDAPPAEISDDEIRDGLRAAAADAAEGDAPQAVSQAATPVPPVATQAAAPAAKS